MMKSKKMWIWIGAAAAAVVVIAVAIVLILNLGGNGPAGPGGDVPAGENTTYSISVKSIGGLPLEGLDVQIWTAGKKSLVMYGRTDENGEVDISAAAGDGYVVELTGVPKGYVVEETYPLTGKELEITLSTQLITDGSLSEVTEKFKLGDVMYDFTVTDTEGNEITLSEMLKEKDMVLLNMWFSTCDPCYKEFPYLDRAYQNYQDKVGVLALNCSVLDDENAVKAYKESMGVSMPMVKTPDSWAAALVGNSSSDGYPTSIVVDRYGVICLIHVGGLTSETPFNSIFNHFTGEDYEQKLCYNGVNDLVVAVKPTFTMPDAEDMNTALAGGDENMVFAPETGKDAEMSWPFVLDESGQVAYASNQGIENSFATLYIKVQLKKGQAIGFDYRSSCANGTDVMYVLVDKDDIYQITGVAQEDKWEKCYPWVADEDGEYEVALCYYKTEGDPQGDDTVYVKNFRIVDAAEVDTPSYIPRQAASSEDGFDFTYVNVVYNEADGYYHVGSANGPLLLADLINTTLFNEEESVNTLLYDGKIVLDGVNYYDKAVRFCNYASNSQLSGVCTVNKELAEYLKIVAQVAGFDGGENEWLKICRYYDAYGTGGQQLEDPIAGLAPFSAFEAKEGKNVPTNRLDYNRTIMPRGLWAKFVPTKSGVYRITSRTDTNSMVEGWLSDLSTLENWTSMAGSPEFLTVYEMSERMYSDESNVSMVYYMEAGTPYFIDLCYYDLYETGTIYYDIEYLGATYDLFQLASPGYFTYDTNATGDAMYYTIAGGIQVTEKNGKYYHLKEDGSVGSLLYADFSGITPIFTSQSLQEVIANGGFNFTRTEDDEFILAFMRERNNDPDATRAYLKEYWGSDYDAYAQEYQLEDVLAGKLHGKGQDLTAQAQAFISKMETAPVERQGCVEVTVELAQLLQKLMDKYTFADVDHSWTKLCYYYEYLGR